MGRTTILWGEEVLTDPDTFDHIPQDLFPYIIKNKLELPLFEQQLVPKFPCFGYLWQDENGVCPQEACKLREGCEKTYTEYQESFVPKENLVREVKKTPKHVDFTKKYKNPADQKYQRKGYRYKDAKIDVFIVLFKMLVGFPRRMPSAFHSRDKDYFVETYGKFAYTMNTTNHGFFYKLKLVVRIWNGKGKTLSIDVSPNIYKLAVKYGFKGKKKELTDTVKLKSGKCEYRLYCKTAADVEVVAKAVKTSLKLKVKQ